MHNVKKKQLSRDQVAAKRQENVKRAAHYNSLSRAAMARRVLGMLDLDSLAASAKVIEVNPDHSTMWNFRRECLQAMHGERAPASEDAGAADSLRQACEGEFALTQACLAINPKSYPVWFHRMWVLQWGRCEWAYPRELKLTTKLLALDDRNFHCWTHRRFVVRASSVPGRSELQFTLVKVRPPHLPLARVPHPLPAPEIETQPQNPTPSPHVRIPHFPLAHLPHRNNKTQGEKPQPLPAGRVQLLQLLGMALPVQAAAAAAYRTRHPPVRAGSGARAAAQRVLHRARGSVGLVLPPVGSGSVGAAGRWRAGCRRGVGFMGSHTALRAGVAPPASRPGASWTPPPSLPGLPQRLPWLRAHPRPRVVVRWRDRC